MIILISSSSSVTIIIIPTIIIIILLLLLLLSSLLLYFIIIIDTTIIMMMMMIIIVIIIIIVILIFHSILPLVLIHTYAIVHKQKIMNFSIFFKFIGIPIKPSNKELGSTGFTHQYQLQTRDKFTESVSSTNIYQSQLLSG